MAKKWDEVAASEGFKALTPDQQDGARRQYFDQVVAPQVPPEHVDRAWDQFSTDVGVGRRALPKDVAPSRAGAGRGVTVPTQAEATPAKPKPPATETIYDPATGMPLGTQEAQLVDGRTVDERRTRAPGRLTDADIPDASAGSVARDVASGVLQIGPTIVKGVGELARLATGDRIGKGLTDAMDRGTEAIQDTVGSERGAMQRKKFAQDMQDPALNAADVIFDNPGALADQVLPTLGSMALPVGAAGAAGKLATTGRAAQLARAIDEGTVLARAEKARQGAVAGTTVAQNAAGTFSDVRDAGGDLGEAYTGAAITAPATLLANRLTGGGAEANAANLLAGTAKGGVKAIPKAMAKEGAQEMGEEGGSYVGESVGKGEQMDANAAGKRMAVAGTLGAVMGGGVEAAGAAGAARAGRETRIKTLRDAGETAAADLLQQKHDKATAAESVDAELGAMPGNEAFAQQYRTLRTAGVKPAEAAARSAVTVTFQGLAQETGVPDKALQAAMTAAQGMPLDKVPGFFQKFTEGLAKRGLIQPTDTMAAIGTSLEAARDDALEAAIGVAYQPVKTTMDAVQALETEQNQPLALVDSTQAATNSIANVQDPTQATGPGTETQTTADQTAAAMGGDAAPTQDLPGAGDATLQASGVDTAAALDERAHAAATSPLNDLPEPTQAQKEAGNYKVGRVNLHGLNISIENPLGSVRRGVGDDGKPWENELAAHYGYIRGTEGNDGDHVDTFIGPNPASERVFVVDQVNKDGSFDEHKVVLGADNLQQADNLYHDNYHEGWTGRGAITEMSMADFKKWVKDGTKTQPLGTLATVEAPAESPAVADSAPPVADKPASVSKTAVSDAQSQPVVSAPAPVPAAAPGKQVSFYPGKFGKGMGKDAANLEAQRLNRANTDKSITYAAEEHGDPKLENPYAVVGRKVTKPPKQSTPPTKLEVTPRADGTVAVKGDAAEIREALKDIPSRSLANMKGGILVGRTQAGKATAILAIPPVKQGPVDPETSKTIAKAKASEPEKEVDTPEPTKIQDFGEKIGGAKKDLWSGFKDDLGAVKDDEIAGRKLSEIWPAPDYQKLIDGGMDVHSVAIIRSLRDEIPAKPRNAYKLKRWADQVKTMRDLAASVLNDKDTGAAVTAQLARGTSQMQGIAGRAALYRAVGHGKSLEGIRLAHHHYSLYRGRENVELWVVERDAGATAFSNWPQELATGDTIGDAIAAFRARYAELDSIAAVKKASFDIITESGKKGFFIGKKIGRNIATLEGPFATLKEAREYRASNLPKLEEKLAKFKEIPKDRRDTNEPRVGEDMRNGQDVTPEMFAEAFGFKGVEFGNWVEQKRRQKDLNDAFDALMDMAAIMGVPAKAISLNGELGLAFGARGSGGVNPAAAHYEPGKVVINLTKREGAGSLGHEWWHALDNYFSRMRGSRTSPFMTTATDVGLSARGANYMPYEGVRKEMIDAFGEVVRSIKQTAIKARSSKMDAKRTKEYWTTGEEMAARAFESYLISKLHDQNASNDYLANVVDEKTWEAMAALGMENEGSYPYPTAGEMPVIRAGFDKFFQTLETKETDQGVAMFARGAPQTEAFKKWLGDSKVVDAYGKPLVMYHGTSKSESGEAFTAFDTYASNYGLMGQGGYFTADPEVASSYTSKGKGTTPTVYSAYLSIKNPIDMDAKADPAAWQKQFDGIEDFHEEGDTNESWYRAAEELIADQEVPMYEGAEIMQEGLRAMGYDGITHMGGGRVKSDGVRHRVYVAFDPEQIKSATGNNGNFDPANPDIRYALGADAFRLGITPRKFMPVADVQKAVDQLTAKWKDGPRIKVVTSPEELPVDAPSDARGLIHKGTAYIVAGNHLDRAGVARTLAHEAIGHYGLWKALGKDGTRQFERNVQLALKSGNKPLGAIAARVRELYVDDAGKFNLSLAEEANEIAAFAVEEALDADGNFKPGFGFLKQVWSKVADFLRGLGFDIKFTNAELQGMLVSSMQGLEGGKRLNGGTESMVAAARDEADVATTLLDLGQNDDLFMYPRSDALELQHIAEDKGGTIKVSDVDRSSDKNEVWMLSNTTPKDNAASGTKSWMLTTPMGKLATLTRKDNEVYINVSGIGEGNGGSAIYDLAANYALNNGLVFVGDPNGVSSAAMRRRLENMLSSAIKYGTTDHIKPHDDQYLGNESLGIPPLDWTKGDTLGNIRHMVDVSIASTKFLFPNSSDHVRFDPATQSFVDAKGRGLDAASIAGILADRGRTRGLGEAGRTTVQRATLYDALVQSPGARRALLGSLRGQQASGGSRLGEGLERTFYARGVTPGLFAPTVWNTPDPTRTDRIIYELQDGRVDLKRVQQAIEQSGQQIEEKWDARLAETLYPGRVAHRSQQFLDAEVKPLLKAMATYGVQMDELADYLHARGAEERNAQVAKVNPDLPDGGAGKNTKGVLLTNQAAKDYLANISPGHKQLLDSLAAKVDAVTAGTRSLLVAEGLEKQDTIDAWTKAYKNYVPMFRDEAQSGAPHPQGSGFSVKGSASKRAVGSTKEVTNILAHVLMQREAAITRAEKNRVALALYGQALSHPNPDFWTTIKPSMSAAAIGKELQAMGVDPMTAAAGMETVPTITTVDAATGKKVDRPNPLYRSLPGAIPLKVNGEDRVLMLNTEKERGARLAENLKNLDGLTKLDLANGILHKFYPWISPKVGIGGATRWLASINTQYNPAFGLVNLTRDTLGAAVNLGSTQLRGNALKVLAKTPVAIYGIARELVQGGKSGKWSKLYRQFQEDGGQTGYKENFRDAGDRAKAIESELAGLQKAGKLTAAPGRVAHALLDLLDGFNTTLENAVRVSAYSAALDAGMSRAEAARLGRELTVDFNRKGRAGREVGPLYAFFNASVQGSARTVQALKGPTGAKIIAGGLGLGALQALMLLAAGYDDDEIPEFVKTRALVIPLNWTGEGEKKHVLVPYPLGLHVLPNTGRVISELALNGGKDFGKRTGDAIGELAGAFNPLGGGNIFTADGFLKTFAPTVVDPVIELGYNRNFAGNSIEREAFNGETDTRPGVARAKEPTQRSTTGQAYIGISKAINAMTGGNDYEAGAVSPTPERIRYLAQTVGGGVLREIEKTINASTAASRGEDVKSSAIPVLGRFYGEVDDDQVKTSRYFENAKRLDKLENTKKTITKAGDAEAMAKLLEENPDVLLISLGNKVQSSVAKLNKLAIQTIGDPESLKQIDATRVQIMDQLNQAVESLEEETKAPSPAAKIKGWRKEAVN